MKKRMAVGGGVAAAVLVGSAVAFGALPVTNGTTINGCYSQGGALKVLTPSDPTCPKGSLPLTWNATGVQGEQGTQGPQGIQGLQGLQGPAGPSQAYSATNTQVIESVAFLNAQLLVGLSDLPAGAYIFWVDVHNSVDLEGGLFFAAMSCKITFNGTDLAFFDVAEFARGSQTVSVTAPAGGALLVSCIKDPGNPNFATLGEGRVTALKVGAIN